MKQLRIHIGAGFGNGLTSSAKRQVYRLLIYAHAMRSLGATVRVGPKNRIGESAAQCELIRALISGLSFFNNYSDECDFAISAVHDFKQWHGARLVIVKGSFSAPDELRCLKASEIYVSWCEDSRQSRGGKWLEVPHFVHPNFMAWLSHRDLMRAYASDDVEQIRERSTASTQIVLIGKAGFMGMRMSLRSQIAKLLPAEAIDLSVAYDGRPIDEYVSHIVSHALTLCLPGVRRKSYRFAETVLLGRLPVIVDYASIVPPITNDNAVVLSSWGDRKGLVNAIGFSTSERARRLGNMTLDYKAGWSPRGQCKQILARMGYDVPD